MSGGLGSGLPQGSSPFRNAAFTFLPNISAQSVGPMPTPSPPQSVLLRADPHQPDTLGWREWIWSPYDKMLKSPSQGALWPEAELAVPHWDEGDVVRGVSGIHAHLVPRHWKILATLHGEYVSTDNALRVHGIVERFGKYVLGTEGWRAEWVIIKELVAPSTEVGLEIEKAYPDVIVHYPEEEGEAPCESVKSSMLGKGSRSVSRPRPATFPTSPPTQFQNVSPLSASQHLQSHLMNQSIALQSQIQQTNQMLRQGSGLVLSLQNANARPPQAAPHDIEPNHAKKWNEDAELKLGAIVFWGFVVVGILAIGRAFS